MSRRKRIKLPPEPVDVAIEKLSHEGKGISYYNERTFFVNGALPGEKVKAKITAKYKGVYEGYAVEISEASEKRVDAPCAYYSVCGGCSLQHLSAVEQLNFKQQSLRDLFKHIAKIEINDLLAPLLGPSLGYRTKARLGVRYVAKKNKVLVGFREKQSNFLADMGNCAVLHPLIGLRLNDLSLMIAGLEAKQAIPQVEVAIGDTRAILVFRHLQSLCESDRQSLHDFGQKFGFEIYTQSGGPTTIIPLNPLPEEQSLPALFYHLPRYDLKLWFAASDFTQVNRIINRQMIDLAIELLSPARDEHILDLFCGLGNFSLPLARKGCRVTGVEGSHELVLKAQENARYNQLENCAFFTADLFCDKGDNNYRLKQWAQRQYHKILIDPPRSGAKEIVSQIEIFKATTIVYVSCNPSTLARDAAILVHEKGYTLINTGIMDMFPHTSHVESIALFQR